MKHTKEIAKSTRTHRKLHRIVGSFLLIFFFLISLTGLLLGWKKHSGGLILPETQKGISADLKGWLSYDSLNTLALQALRDSLPGQSPRLDRIDARPDKGIVKFVFKDHYTEIQLDATSGKVLAVNQRTSDIIEQIHDGSILDFMVDTSNGQIKLVYTTLTGGGLALLSFTGFWLWYNPRRIRKRKEQPE
ncbi:MAG: PepSY-associated TM helix domain-containing protein [Cyclobacteriaceae bacterium]|nr:MAG: PepSY-associated TM helix domain-containing protein [Cyclobacteriaceae bacterium]